MEQVAQVVEGAIDAGRSQPRLERLGEWFTAEYDGLLRFAFLVSGNLTAAEDLVHEAFVRLYRADRRIEIAGFRAYARRTIINLNRSAFRRLIVERRAIAAHGPGSPAETPTVEPQLWKAVLELPRQQRACIVLRFYEGMTDHEIAETLGVGSGTVKKAMHRAMTALRAQLGTEE
jgi:RNA polymerase sigma-70 factor (sigma-E family)